MMMMMSMASLYKNMEHEIGSLPPPPPSTDIELDNSMTVATPALLKLVSEEQQQQQQFGSSTDGCHPSNQNQKLQFPFVLYRMIEENQESGIVTWTPSGMSFKILDRDAFMKVVPRYFKLSKFRSFTRQLNMWSFVAHQSGATKGEYSHPYFVRGRPDLLPRVTRMQQPNRTRKATKKQQQPAKQQQVPTIDISMCLEPTPLPNDWVPSATTNACATPSLEPTPKDTLGIPSLENALSILWNHENNQNHNLNIVDTNDTAVPSGFAWGDETEDSSTNKPLEDAMTAYYLRDIKQDLSLLRREMVGTTSSSSNDDPSTFAL